MKKLHRVLNPNTYFSSVGVPLNNILTSFQNNFQFRLRTPSMEKNTHSKTDRKTATHGVVAWSREAAVPQGHQSPHCAENPL